MNSPLLRRESPRSLPPSIGASQLVEARGPLFFISGQVAETADGSLVGKNDFVTQVDQVFHNLSIAVHELGTDFSHIVKLNYYCVESVDRSLLPQLAAIRDKYIDRSRPPASSFVFVSGLARRSWLIEIEAVVSTL